MDDEELARVAASHGQPLSRGDSRLIGLRKTTARERGRHPLGQLVFIYEDSNGRRMESTTWSGATDEDPNWRGEAVPLSSSVARHRNLRDPRPKAGLHTAKRVNIRCPSCGALVAEIHEYERGVLFHRTQSDWWGVVRFSAGRIGAGCEKCLGVGDEIDVDLGKVADAFRKSEALGRPVTVKTGWAPRPAAE